MEVLIAPGQAGAPEPEVVRKTATLPGERERLLREAEVLRLAGERRVPGLPVVISRPSPDEAEPSLITAAVRGPSLAVAAPLPVAEVAGVVAEVARLLAGLHEAGLVHGSLGPSHVVLDGGGGAILVGLGEGGPAGAPSPDPGVGALDPAADVAAWGMLVGHLLDWSATGDDEPLAALRRSLAGRPTRRAGRRLPAHRPGEHERRVLAALADQAQDPDPARRPAARSLAAAVTHRIPHARVPGAVAVAAGAPAGAPALLDRLAAHVGPGPGPGGADAAPPEPAATSPATGAGAAIRRPPLLRLRPRRATTDRRRPAADRPSAPEPVPAPAPVRTPAPVAGTTRSAAERRRRGLVIVAGAIVALLGAPLVLHRPRAPTSTAVTRPQPARCAPAPPPAADADGDGCEEPVRWDDGILVAGSARFALGGRGDAWAVGDWDCDGRRTPALLHQGVLAVFDAWPGPGAELRGREVATAGGATGLGVSAGPGGCEQPVLRRPGGEEQPVDARSPP